MKNEFDFFLARKGLEMKHSCDFSRLFCDSHPVLCDEPNTMFFRCDFASVVPIMGSYITKNKTKNQKEITITHWVISGVLPCDGGCLIEFTPDAFILLAEWLSINK